MGLNIDRRLLPLKAHYFLFNAGTAPVIPFMPTLAKQLGFSPTVVGTIYAILPVTGMLAKPLFGFISDRYQKRKSFFLLFQLITAISFFGILFIKPKAELPNVEVHCNHNVSDIQFCPRDGVDSCNEKRNEVDDQTSTCDLQCDIEPWMSNILCENWLLPETCNKTNDFSLNLSIAFDHLIPVKKCIFARFSHAIIFNRSVPLYCPAVKGNRYFNATCKAYCPNTELGNLIAKENVIKENVTKLYEFWLFLFLLVVGYIGMAVVVSVGDTICFEMLENRYHLYGNQRLWGAIGFGIFSLLAGYLVDKLSSGAYLKDYTIVFCMTLVLIGLDILVSWRIQYLQAKVSSKVFVDVSSIFLSAKIIVFFLWCIVVGLCTALVWNLLFWYLEELADVEGTCNDHNWIKTLQGLAMCVQCFGGEVPLFFLSGWILKKIGHVNAMALVLLGFGLRFILYSLLTNPWWVLPIELLNGLTFGIFYPTMTSYASIIAPPGTEATLQGLVGAVFEGIGVSIGSLVGGILFDNIGGRATFRIYGSFALCVFACHLGGHLFWRKLRTNDPTPLHSPQSAVALMLES